MQTNIFNFLIGLNQAWATSGPRATCGPPITLMWPANIILIDKTFKNAFWGAYFDKMDNYKPIFSQKSYQIGPYCTYTGPHLLILFPMWPTSQKELHLPGLDSLEDFQMSWNQNWNGLGHLTTP